MEIRSYRRVFDLERRVYSIDSLRLNPGGVPVRGILYFVGLFTLGLIMGGLPLLGTVVHALPWYLRDLALPGGAATVLGMLRVEGRTFHLAALTLVRFWLGPRRLAGLRPSSAFGRRWYPDEVLILPDGSDPQMRRMRYTGPGAVRVMIEHERAHSRGRAALSLRQHLDGRTLERGEVILLAAGARMLVRSAIARRSDK